jgi:hypothetical protein
VTWKGVVESISPATGAEFAILPPQNASGNWVKVVQRLPVRIRLEPHARAPPCAPGWLIRRGGPPSRHDKEKNQLLTLASALALNVLV